MCEQVEFNGKIYKKVTGKWATRYFRRKEKGKIFYLHREIWKFYNGEIPKGCVVHHKDLNPFNNSIENLVCLTPREHSKLHNSEEFINPIVKETRDRIKYSKENWKERREKALLTSQIRRGICKECGKEYQVTNVHQKYCCPKCRKRANTRDSKKEQICEICGAVFIAPTYYSRTTCSNECAHKASVANRKRRSI